MMLKRYRVLLLMVIVALLVLLAPATHTPPPTNAQTTTTIPYLIYYDGAQMRVERADGANSFGIGPVAPEPDADFHVRTLAVSPSGEWVLLHTNGDARLSPTVTPMLALVNIYTTETVLMEEGATFAEAKWHPTEDVVLVATASTETENTSLRMRIIFPQRDGATRTLADWDFGPDTADDTLSLQRTNLQFGFAGSTVKGYVSYVVRRPDGASLTQVVVFTSEGLLRAEQFPDTDNVHISPSGILLHQAANGLRFDDLSTVRNVTDVSVSAIALLESFVAHQWTPDGNGVLINSGGPIHFIDLNDLAQAPRSLPIVTLVADGTLSTFDDEYFGEHTAGWSADGRYFALQNLTTNERLIFDRETGATNALPEGVSGQAVVWRGDTVLLVDGRADAPALLHTYNAATTNLTTREIELPFNLSPSLAPDGELVGVNAFGVNLYNMQNPADDQRLSTDSRSYLTSQRGEIVFHPSAPYALVQTDGLVAGGGTIWWGGVQALDGSHQRELEQSKAVRSSIGVAVQWLPPLDEARLPTGENRTPDWAGRVASYFTGHWAFDMAWNAESSALLVGGNPHSAHRFSIIEVEAAGASAPRPVTFDNIADYSEIFSSDLIFEGNTPGFVARAPYAADPTRIVLDSAIQPASIVRETTPVVLLLEAAYGTSVSVVEDLAANGNTPEPVLLTVEPQPRSFNGTGNFSPMGFLMAYGGTIYEVILEAPRATLPYGHVQAMAFSPSGEWIAVAAGYRVDIWRVDDLIDGLGG